MQILDGGIGQLVLVESSENIQCFVWTVMGHEPARRVWYHHDDEDHGYQEDGLQTHWYSPGVAAAPWNCAKSIVYPLEG